MKQLAKMVTLFSCVAVLACAGCVTTSTTVPPLNDPAFAGQASARQLQYLPNKRLYTLGGMEGSAPVELKLDYGFIKSSTHTDWKMALIPGNALSGEKKKSSFTLHNGVDGRDYHITVRAARTELFGAIELEKSDREVLAIIPADAPGEKAIFVNDKNGGITGTLGGHRYTVTDRTRERFGRKELLAPRSDMANRLYAVSRDGLPVARYVKGRMGGALIPGEIYVSNTLDETARAQLLTVLIGAHQSLLLAEQE